MKYIGGIEMVLWKYYERYENNLHTTVGLYRLLSIYEKLWRLLIWSINTKSGEILQSIF